LSPATCVRTARTMRRPIASTGGRTWCGEARGRAAPAAVCVCAWAIYGESVRQAGAAAHLLAAVLIPGTRSRRRRGARERREEVLRSARH
jgi:hypothetical protein